ncbi:response regulator transcription factor [Sphingomonas jaspsi]|uniref:response regulator transcription factor n=1 Tax=Sphingomonas jaspsi TaxID=392409 RepID=UPI0004B4F47C|nr:response regulator [Sphingomonas jaspsi]
MARIILVDDDPVIGELVCNALMSAGHAVGWLPDGETALRVMRGRAPHLAIVDCAMPGLSGVHLVRTMRSDGRLCHIPALMLTARHGLNDEAIAYGAGADDYLRKPVDFDLLAGRVEALLLQSQRPNLIAM